MLAASRASADDLHWGELPDLSRLSRVPFPMWPQSGSTDRPPLRKVDRSGCRSRAWPLGCPGPVFSDSRHITMATAIHCLFQDTEAITVDSPHAVL